MISAIRSYFSGLKASNLFGRASRLRDSGRKEEALEAARQSLAVLRSPWVVRHRPAEGSVLLCAVMLIEQVASELNQQGAEDNDLADALANLKNLPPSSSLEIIGSTDWVPYFESRLRKIGDPDAV